MHFSVLSVASCSVLYASRGGCTDPSASYPRLRFRAQGKAPRSSPPLLDQGAAMKAEELRALQTPVKTRYKLDPAAALVTLKASGSLGAEAITCKVATGKALVEAGLHPATGGDGLSACSGDMLLEALVGCAGVTLRAVATALEIPVRGGTVSAEGDLDFRGTLGVSKETPVGFQAIRLHFELDS